MIVRTPVVLPIYKSSSNQCCAKCYMKNRRSWEKQATLRTTHYQHQNNIALFVPGNTVPLMSVNPIPFDMNSFLREKTNIDNSINETSMLQNTLITHFTPIVTSLLSQEERIVIQTFTLELNEYSNLLHQLKVLSNKLISSNGAILPQDYLVYSVFTQQVKKHLIKLTSAFTAFSAKPSFQPLIPKLLTCFQSNVNSSFDTRTSSPILAPPQQTENPSKLPSVLNLIATTQKPLSPENKKQDELPHFSSLFSDINTPQKKSTHSKLGDLARIASLAPI